MDTSTFSPLIKDKRVCLRPQPCLLPTSTSQLPSHRGTNLNREARLLLSCKQIDFFPFFSFIPISHFLVLHTFHRRFRDTTTHHGQTTIRPGLWPFGLLLPSPISSRLRPDRPCGADGGYGHGYRNRMVPGFAHATTRTDSLQDLGTTYSCVGVMQKGKVDILVNDQGKQELQGALEFRCPPTVANEACSQETVSLLPTWPLPNRSDLSVMRRRTRPPPTRPTPSTTSSMLYTIL